MALIPGRCRRTWGHRKIQNTTRYTALAPDRFNGFWKDQACGSFRCCGRFAAFTASCSQWSARSIQRALRCSSSARSASRRQASALGVTAPDTLHSRNPVPRPDCCAAPRRWQSGLHSIHGRAQHLPPANRCRYSRRWRSLTQHLQRRPGFPFPQVRPTAAGAPRRESRPY